MCLVLSITLAAQQVDSRQSVLSIAAAIENFNSKEFPADSVSTDFPMGSFTEPDFLRRYLFYKKIYAQLEQIKPDTIDANSEINLELLKHSVREEMIYYEYKEYLNPILSDEGFHTSFAHKAGQSYTTTKAFNAYIKQLAAFPKYARQQIALMREGLRVGISQPAVALEGYANTYNQHITNTIEQSVFFKPFLVRPYGISNEDWKQLVAKGSTTIGDSIIPAYKSINAFFENEYYGATRKTLGASAFPKGLAYYNEKVKHYTTTNLTAQQVYEIGLQEVARIKIEMQQVLAELKYEGSIKSFIDYLRNEPRFFPSSGESLLKEASFIAKKIDGKLPMLFGRLPRQPYGVAPVPDYLAPTYTTGRYSGAPIGSKRAGNYWVNTYNLKSRTLYTLEALTLHEAVPGHHLQIALAQELENLPAFRRNMYINAFGEGWGLYAEYLGYELGLYQDPYSRFGRLTYEMWRACRLVIDVGIHTKNWTRDEAVKYLADNTALSLHEVNTEINRYISWPGQALSYKIGEIKIKALRKKAEETLKEKFDIRAFHDLVLSQGSITLSLLEKLVDNWIKKISRQ